MSGSAPTDFRLTVLNPGGRDAEQRFEDGAGEPAVGHQPTNFHGYAACSAGSFHRDVERASAEQTPVLLLLRGDFKESERALAALKRAGRVVAVSLKETGLHQIADQLRRPDRLARFIRIIKAADGCIAATPEAAAIYSNVRGDDTAVRFIPTPYPVVDRRWNFAKGASEASGVFIGTREFDVLSRNHLAALFVARELSDKTGEAVTVYNFDGRSGERLLAECGFKAGMLRIRHRRLAYTDYLGEIATHKIVLQLDTSFVPGQVAGDALLAAVPCVGGNGAIDRLAFPHTCGFQRTPEALRELAARLVTDQAARDSAIATARENGTAKLSFATVRAELAHFFAALSSN